MEMDMGETEPAADETAVAKDLLQLIGLCVRGNVEVLGFTAKQKVAHTAADEIGPVSPLFQTVKHPDGIGTDPFAGDRVLFSGDDRGLNGSHG